MTGAVLKLKHVAPPVLLIASACGTGTDAPAPADEVVRVYRGATLVDGTGADPVENAVIVVRGDRIEAVGQADAIEIPDSAVVQQLDGMWIIPGLVDAHVHFGQSGWFDGRPDALDLRAYHPYEEVVSRLAAAPELFSDAYLCSGVTSVFDVGGYGWSLDLQKRRETDPRFVRVAATGPMLSTIDFWLNAEDDRQFIFMADSAAVGAAVRETADRGAAAIKIWYIVPPTQDSAAVLDLVRHAARESEARGLPLVVHATGLWEATAAIEAGADVLVHGVFDVEVDEGFLELARDAGIIYVPTLTVTEGYLNVFSQVGMEGLPYPGDCVDGGTRALLDSELPAEWRPPGEVVTRYREFVETNRALGIENLRRVHEAGITVAMGTDAGNPGTLHGPAIHYEARAFQEAGMSAAEVLVAATRNAARAMGWDTELGTIEEGKLADFVILRADPLAAAANLTEVAHVVLGGRRAWPLE